MRNRVEKPISNVEALNKFYKPAPGNLTFFALSPYLLTYGVGASLGHVTPYSNSRHPRTRMNLAGISYCALFTALPVLPAGTALTLGLAAGAGVITALSAAVAYPVAAVLDSRDAIPSQAPTVFRR